MTDPGFVSGFIGVGIDMAIEQILEHMNIALRCKKELASLKDLVMKIQPIILQIQQYRVVFNKKIEKASAVNAWLKEMDALLTHASKMVQQCTIPTFKVISRYRISRRITGLITDINEHLKLSPLVELAQSQELLIDAIGQMKATMEGHIMASDSTTSQGQGTLIPTGSAKMKLIDEPLIVGQDKAFANLDKLVMGDAEARNIGVVGKGGSGKTLILKRIFNGQKVRDLFCDGLLLWLTVSQNPSITSLRNELYTQITLQKKMDLGKNMNEDDVKIWLNQTLQQSKMFVLLLDDVWGADAGNLLEDLGILRPVSDHAQSKVIISSRDRSAVLKMGVADKYTITMEDLIKDESWRLFAYHAFPYNNGNLPANIDEETAKLVCQKCAGLPLAIKVVGRAMAGSTDPQEWQWALERLPHSDSLYDCVRLSYGALGNEDVNIQFCFLHAAAAFIRGQILRAHEVILLWVGEGLLARKMLQGNKNQLGHDPFDIGRIYLNILADRYLIEPLMRDIDGRVEYFRMHDVVRDLAIRIAEEEEKFFCGVGKGFTALDENQCSGRTRILLSNNNFSSLPKFTSCPEMCSLLVSENKSLTRIPRRVIGSVTSLKVLDFSWTPLQSLPDSVGCLKQLVCLRLVGAPMAKLPASLTNLASLQLLDLAFSRIRELPSGLHKLRSLRYLGLRHCRDLQYLPCSISRLTSLQYLHMQECNSLWTKPQGKICEKVASIKDLGNLTKLRRLHLQNNGGSITEGTFGRLTQMDTLRLILTKIESLPADMSNMSKLRRLALASSHLVRMDNKFCDFSNMSTLILYKCVMLEELPCLQKMKSLRRLEIIECCNLRKFPREFGEAGAFSLLEIFSLVSLDELEELPSIKEGAMPLLKIFTMMECKALEILPQSYFNLKSLQKIRIYGCSKMVENLLEIKDGTTMIEVVIMSMEDTAEAKKKYFQIHGKENWFYSDFWCNEIFLFLRGLNILI